MSKSLRDFLKQIDSSVTTIQKSVPLDYVGALISQCEGSILFENIQGFPGWRMCDQFFKNRELQGKVLGVEPHQVVSTLASILEKGPTKPRIVQDGPVKEVKWIGEEADLTRLPVPRHTGIDPGPYITGFNIIRDPETGIYNSCIPRTLVKGPREAVSSYVTTDSNRIMQKYKALGKPMPQAICIGHHPALELAVNFSGKHDGFHELDLAGTILGEPVDMVRCETIDLYVPADCEIVIEGYIHPDRLEDDGPSPSPALYFCPYVQKQPFFEVTAITMRKDAIYRHFQSTVYTDHQPLPRLFHEAILYNRLKEMRVNVKDVFFPSWGGALSLIIQMQPKVDGEVQDVLMMAMGSPWVNTKMVVALDEDVNIYDPSDVYHSLSTRVDSSKDVLIVPNTRGSSMDPSAKPIPESGGARMVGKWGIDATKPPAYHKSRIEYERAWPMHWGEVSLKDYLNQD